MGRRRRHLSLLPRRQVRDLTLHRKTSVSSAFGAAGSLAVLLVWIYYSSQIVLFGAEFTRVYGNEYGSHVVAADNAIPVPATPLARAAMEKQIKDGEVPDSPGPTPVRPGQ